MANEFFTASGNPATRATATSASMRAEFAAIVAAFDKLPTMTGNGGKLLVVNSAGTALAASSTIYDISGSIGIGTNAPVSALDVRTSTGANITAGRTVNAGASSEPGYFDTYAPNASGTGMVWTRIKPIVSSATAGAESTNLVFMVRGAGALTERMRIDASGNLLIATTANAGSHRVMLTGSSAINQGTGSFRYVDSSTGAFIADMNAADSSGTIVFRSGASVTERMRIDASGNVGVGTTSPNRPITISNTNAQIQFVNATTGTTATDGLLVGMGGGASADAYINQLENANLIFNTNATERMRIDASGNVGVGTTSPASKLHVAGDIQQDNASYLKGKLAAGTTTRLFGLNASNALYVGSIDADHTGGTLFVKNGSTQATLDASGNLGLGVTPSTWTSYKALEVSALGNALYSVSSELGITSNAYFNAGWKYAAGAISPTRYASGSGAHVWYTAGTGSIGAAITWTTAMTLDASGRLKAGTTGNPVSSLIRMLVQGDATTGGAVELVANGGGGVVFDPIAGGGVTISRFTGAVGAETYTSSLIVDSSGRLLHGTTSASVTNGGFLWVPGADSIGYIGHASGSASGNGFFAFQLAGVQIGSITQNGTTAVAYNTSSDYRLKDITGPVTGSGEYIDALNPVVGSWKADGAPFVGLIAHEVQDISSTQVATGVKDGEVMQSMDYSAPEIMANIIAELKSLRARVANLEAA